MCQNNALIKNSIRSLIDSFRFIHVYKGRSVSALYNAITFDLIYIDNELMESDYLETKEYQKLMHILNKMGGNNIYDIAFEKGKIKELRAQVKKNQIKMLTIILTTKCNFACKYCHLKNIKHKSGIHGYGTTISERQIRQGLEIYARYSSMSNGPKDILLYGGEPLLAKERIKFIINYLKMHKTDFNGKINIILITNGSLMDRDFARFLKENAIFVIISLDGGKKENDLARVTKSNEGTFKLVERALKILKQGENKFGISITVGKHNVNSIQDSLINILNRFKPYDFGLNSCFHTINGKKNDYQADSGEAAKVLIKCFKTAIQKGFYAEQLFRRIRPFILKRPRLKDCSSCGGRLVLTPYGTMGFCDSFAYTNEYCTRIEAFDLFNNEDYNLFKNISPVNNEGCLSCPSVTICGGGCRYDAYYQSGSITGLDAYRCEQANVILEWLIWELYNLIDDKTKKSCSIISPTDRERRMLAGNIKTMDEDIPMSTSNMYGEI